MAQKKLQKDSVYSEYDEDGDGIVSDEELSHIKEIKKTETELRKNVAQLRMARYTLIFMGCYAVFMASHCSLSFRICSLRALAAASFAACIRLARSSKIPRHVP